MIWVSDTQTGSFNVLMPALLRLLVEGVRTSFWNQLGSEKLRRLQVPTLPPYIFGLNVIVIGYFTVTVLELVDCWSNRVL